MCQGQGLWKRAITTYRSLVLTRTSYVFPDHLTVKFSHCSISGSGGAAASATTSVSSTLSASAESPVSPGGVASSVGGAADVDGVGVEGETTGSMGARDGSRVC